MNHLKSFIVLFVLKLSLLPATEFTVSSYNCGGLSNHYDYLRAATMQKLTQERFTAEPEAMSLNEKIQNTALKILFAHDPAEKAQAQQEWDQKRYQELFEHLTAVPTDPGSVNRIWNNKSENMITTYKVRPIVIHDETLFQMLNEHLGDLCQNSNAGLQEHLQEARQLMGTRIFARHLNFDIICLQEADYLDSSMFPENYRVMIPQNHNSKNGIAWNKDRFELVKSLGDVLGRAIAVKLRDKTTGKTVLIASGHITGCNPYSVAKDPVTGIADSAKGDNELNAIIRLFDDQEADLKIIGMDSNVTSLHPRLNILKENGFKIDYENHLESTCTNPYLVLNTRIDWIALQTNLNGASITNIPVLSVGLNNMQTNMSDHKPVAAKIVY